ncbi:antitoxin VapB family protein [Candidatus Woesearchaeota archaeon]|nr:antitoxin VapB family protein [Candidatus Woesearchaeota archaeon]
MMTRVISLSDTAYESLKSLKNGSESFSEVVNRLTAPAKKASLLDLAGKWSGSKEELDRIEKEIYASRKKFKLRKVEY